MSEFFEDNITLVRLANQGDKEAQSKIVENNIGLIWSIVKKFANRGYELDDIFQIGCMGFIKAIKKFDFSYEVKFSTYAVPMIIGEIKRFLRDDGLIKVSRSIKETSNKARVVREILGKEFGREPTISEISDRLGVAVEELAMAMDAGMSPESLYSPVFESDSNPVLLIDRVNQGEGEETKIINKIVLNEMLGALEPREKKVIILRYFKEKTQTQIANILGISQVQVSRIEKRILEQMRKKIADA